MQLKISCIAFFLRAMSQAGMLACTFGDCRRGQYPAALLRGVDCLSFTKRKAFHKLVENRCLIGELLAGGGAFLGGSRVGLHHL